MNDHATDALFQPEAQSLLAEMTQHDASTDVLREVSRLRAAGHDPDVVAAVMTQRRLRLKAVAKFSEHASRCLFTDAGLQQATRLVVSRTHAARFAAAGIDRVADLGCGIGGDAIALAERGIAVTAVDRDETTARCVAHNLSPFPRASALCADVTDVDLTEFTGLWFDPARRSTGKRLHDPADWSPSLTWVFEQAARAPSGIKLGPAIEHDLLPDDCEAQWVESDGETVECVVWTGQLARPGITRSALVIRSETHELVGDAEHTAVEVGPLGRYLYEPSGAVIRAQLLVSLAAQLSAHTIAHDIAYLSSDAHTESPFAAAFAVRELLPLDIKKVAARMRELGIGALEIKKRGVDIDPAQFRTALKLKGSASATLILTRLGDGRAAILVDRI